MDSVLSVKYNHVEHQILASTASDRSICLYDTRQKTPLKKILMRMATNALCWNPMEAFIFSTANEDSNAYTFDMRKLDHAVCIHKDHVSAVLTLDYSPTGREFVTGSYDRTMRIWKTGEPRSRDVYFTKRMQKVFVVKFSADSKYILSGSDEFNIRAWRAKAAERVKTLTGRERTALEYRQKLKDKFKYVPTLKKILNQRPQTPRFIKTATQMRAVITKKEHRITRNVRAHSKPGTVPFVSVKKKVVTKEIE